MLHLMLARTPALRIELHTITMDVDQYEFLGFGKRDDWTVERFDIADYASRLRTTSGRDGQVRPASIVQTAAYLLTGGIDQLTVQWGTGTPRDTREYSSPDEHDRDRAWTWVTQRKAVLVGFSDRQARMVFDAVTAGVPTNLPLALARAGHSYRRRTRQVHA